MEPCTAAGSPLASHGAALTPQSQRCHQAPLSQAGHHSDISTPAARTHDVRGGAVGQSGNCLIFTSSLHRAPVSCISDRSCGLPSGGRPDAMVLIRSGTCLRNAAGRAHADKVKLGLVKLPLNSHVTKQGR